MSQVAGARHTCENCGKTFVPKPEWYGKKVKCRCGYIMSIPVPPAPKEEPVGDDMYDLAPEAATVKAKQHAAPPDLVAASAAKAAVMPVGGGAAVASPVLGYRTPAAKKEEDRFSSSSSTMMDPRRDLYVPLGLLIGGLLAYVVYYATSYHMSAGGIAMTMIGLSVVTIFKAALLFGFALVVAGPLGVSFGGIWTAALKLAAIAVFTDGLTTWADAAIGRFVVRGGFFGGAISYPLSLGSYWLWLIYLFSMDPGDSWVVVIVLSIFDRMLKWVILLLVVTSFMNWSSGGSYPPGGGGGGSRSGIPGASSGSVSEEDAEFQESKDDGSLVECLKWGKEHTSMMEPLTQAFYNAGAKGCYFEIIRDFNQKPTIAGYVVELPKEKDKRDKIYQVYTDHYKAQYGEKIPPHKPPEGNWLKVPVRVSGF